MSKRTDFLLINALSLIIYFLVFFNLDTGISAELMFSTPDSLTYLDVARWIEGGPVNESLSIRPILYPGLILLTSKIHAVYGLWLLQLSLWLLTINFVFHAIRNITGSSLSAYFGAAIVLSNISLIALTRHALTEVTTTFLLSLLVFFVVRNKQRMQELSFFHGFVLLLAALTILKPLFFIPLLFTLIVILPFFYLKQYNLSPSRLLVLLLVLTPLFAQLTIMKLNFGAISVSQIGPRTVNDYLFTQGAQLIERVSWEQAGELVNASSYRKKIDYFSRHKNIYWSLFIINLSGNVQSYPTTLSLPGETRHHAFTSFMLQLNKTYYYIHLFFILPILLLAYFFFRDNNHAGLMILLGLSSMTAYYIVITGISFWQGDRLVLPAIGIWPVLYVFASSVLLARIRRKSTGDPAAD